MKRLSHIKVGKEIIAYGDIEIEKKFTAIKVAFYRRCRYWEILSI